MLDLDLVGVEHAEGNATNGCAILGTRQPQEVLAAVHAGPVAAVVAAGHVGGVGLEQPPRVGTIRIRELDPHITCSTAQSRRLTSALGYRTGRQRLDAYRPSRVQPHN